MVVSLAQIRSLFQRAGITTNADVDRISVTHDHGNAVGIDTRFDFYMAVALGHGWVKRLHASHDVPIGERNLEQHPSTFTDDGLADIVREVNVRLDGHSRLMRDGTASCAT